MAEIVLGIGMSHTPLLALDWSEWQVRAEADYENKALNLSDGRFVSYQELVSEVGEPYGAIATPEQFEQSARRCQASLDRLAEALEEANPDVVMVIGDDQGELFSLANMPMMSIFYGEEVVTNDVWGRDDKPDWANRMAVSYRMDRIHRFPAAPALALDLIHGLADAGIDIGAASSVPRPQEAGFGHAFGFVAERLFRTRDIPMLPVLLNTYFPPNVMTSARAFAVGGVLRSALANCAEGVRVAVIASGGLSHFVVDEALDHQVLAGLKPGNSDLLTSIPRPALQSGSSEILNWIMTAGAVDHLDLAWTSYEPARRTPAGTGTGVAFALWQ